MNTHRHPFRAVLISLQLLVATFFCAHLDAQSGPSKILSYSELTGTRYDTLVVASVGSLEITAKEFLLSYEYGPAFVKRGEESRNRFLEFMVYEKLLALDGYARHLDTTQTVSGTVAEIEGDLATEELYREDILSQVKVSEAEVTRAVQREKSHLTLKWLFAPTFDEIHELQTQLTSGVPFDSLFFQQLSDSVALEDRVMQTTLFKLETKNPALSAIVDTLNYGKNSAAIGTADGWYIVRLTDLWTNVITTESEQRRIAYNVRRALFKRKADAVSDRYVRELMLDHDPVIKRRTFDLLRATFGKRFFPPEQFAEWKLTKKLMAEFGPVDSVRVQDHLDKVLVAFRADNLTLADFMAWYQARESTIHLSARSRQSFFVSLEHLIWQMVRDKLLVKEALRRNFQQRESVQTQKRWWLCKAVSAFSKSELANEIQLDTTALKKFYEQNKRAYKKRDGAYLPWNKIRAEVWREAFNTEWNRRLLHRLLALKQKYVVKINHEVLNDLPIDIENQRTAIEVYAVKQGGTFPRPAFPTIDYEWKAWY